MTSSTSHRLDAFRASLDDAGVTHERVAVDDATDAIGRAVEPPAVGVELPLDAALPETVATEFAPAALQAARTGVTPASLGIAENGVGPRPLDRRERRTRLPVPGAARRRPPFNRPRRRPRLGRREARR